MSRLDYYDGGRLIRVPDLSVPPEITQSLAGPDVDQIDCPGCEGRGEIADYYNGYVGCWETRQCPGCDGMGGVTPDEAIDIRERMTAEQEF